MAAQDDLPLHPNAHPLIEELEKNILKKTNTDPRVVEAAREGRVQGLGGHGELWNRAFNHYYRQGWDSFIQIHPELAQRYKDYEPITKAYERQEYQRELDGQRKQPPPKPRSLQEDPQYRAFIDHAQTGLNARVWEGVSPSEPLTGKEYGERAKIIRGQMDQQFTSKRPDIVRKYNNAHVPIIQSSPTTQGTSLNETIPLTERIGSDQEITSGRSGLRVSDTAAIIQAAKDSAPPSIMQQAQERIITAAEQGRQENSATRIEKAASRLQHPLGLVNKFGMPLAPTQTTIKTKQASTAGPHSPHGLYVSGAAMSSPGIARKIVRGIKGEGSPSAHPGEDARLTFLRPAYERWRYLSDEHPELRESITTHEQFNEWLLIHPGLLHPTTGKPVIFEDWIDHNTYLNYLELLNQPTGRNQNSDKERKRRSHGNDAHISLIPLAMGTSDVDDSASSDISTPAEGASSFYEDGTPAGQNVGESQMGSSADGGAQTPSFQQRVPSQSSSPSSEDNTNEDSNSNRGDNGSGGNGQPPRRGRRRAPTRNPRVKGAVNMAKLAGKAANVAKIARVAAFFATPPGWITLGVIAIIIIILILIIILTGGGDGGSSTDVNVTVEKSGPTKVENPESQVLTENDVSDIGYEIKVSWSGDPSSIIVKDTIPENTSFIIAGDSGIYDADNRTVTWTISPKDPLDPENFGIQSSLLDKFISPSLSHNLQGISASMSKWVSNKIVQSVYAATVDFKRYTQDPFNLPDSNGESDIDFTPEIMSRLNTLGNIVGQYQSFLTTKYDAILVDPFLSVIWNGAIEGIGGNQFYYNCHQHEFPVNSGCPTKYYSSGNWQVGWGMQVSQVASHAVEDFNAAYGEGKADDATYVKSIGQAVIDASSASPDGKITRPSAFPNKSLSTIVNEAENGNQDSQQALAILLMDDKLGAIALAREVAGDIGSVSGNWAETMRGWDGSDKYYSNNMQTFSNRAKAIADLYSGVGGTGGGLFSGSQILELILRPTTPDSWVINYVTAQAIGGGSGTGGTPGGGTGAPNPDATCPGKGPLTCGSFANPTAGDWGHCNATYMDGVSGASEWCYTTASGGQSSAYYGIDITNGLNDPVYIPKISVGGELRTVTCIFSDYIDSDGLPQTILILSCADDKNDEPVWMQFHHSDVNNKMVKSGVSYKSGDQVATTGNYSGNEHVHFQLGIDGPCGSDTVGCVNADEYVQCNQ